jgi:molybdopterin converting factor small subunit
VIEAMEIEVKLFATLRDYLPKGSGQFSCRVEIDSTDTVRNVLGKLKIPQDIPKIILVNGVHSNLDRVLKYGDVVSVFPPVAGG